jgi:hypothetical protein
MDSRIRGNDAVVAMHQDPWVHQEGQYLTHPECLSYVGLIPGDSRPRP